MAQEVEDLHSSGAWPGSFGPSSGATAPGSARQIGYAGMKEDEEIMNVRSVYLEFGPTNSRRGRKLQVLFQ